MAEKALIPLERSEFGETALHYMEDLIENLEPKVKPEITLMTVISPHVEHISVEGGYVDIDDPGEDLEQEKIEALNYLDKSGDTLRNKGAVVQSKVVLNDKHIHTYESIIKVEEEIHPDIVAMSVHHRSMFTKWIHHNTADKVSQKGKVPVVLVKVN